ncbi:uncharacterized protein PpBr36_11366 [Pyricularia pennisetigena]|uniref:uncharacterized protein n=1 Tax=Pyricularia pennisetigena TaxID=1578925 RepID=UPI00115017E3|nr:uncharacterized protein PpBr36_11366 [Pyricularia pennisetigena]TLS20366.1 hypothetical protein PpBr36_11366 [Pyricularia pennisetigena]
MKKKNKASASGNGLDDDTRPESSPYAASIIELKLGDGTALKVPSFLLRKCPKLHTKIQTWTQIVSLLEITQDIGHVLVHYLFTNTYQCLLPKGTAHEKMCSEYRTASRVYRWTRDYELSDLEELAKAEVIRLGSGLPFPTVLGLLRNAYPTPRSDDVWFRSYLKDGLKLLVQDPSLLAECAVSKTNAEKLSISDLSFEVLMELVGDPAALPQGDANPPTQRDLNSSEEVEAPLLYHMAQGNVLCGVEKVLKDGADVNAQGGRYGNALQAASLKGHNEIVQILVHNGVSCGMWGMEKGFKAQSEMMETEKKLPTGPRLLKLLYRQGSNVKFVPTSGFLVYFPYSKIYVDGC